MRAAAYGLPVSVLSARSLASVHAACRNCAPSGRPHSRLMRAIASVPSGASVAAGPVTSMRTDAIRVGTPVSTTSVTAIGVVLRSILTSIAAEKYPSAAAKLRVSSIASRASRARRSSVISA